MNISGFNKLTLLDYPNKLAAIIFTQGCNFDCPFCQNSLLIHNSCESIIGEEEVLSYLEKRKNILDGVVISGGEPTLQKNLISFIRKIKKLGYSVKLDTNGFRPNVLQKLLDLNLIDYVAMDIKNTFSKYHMTCGIEKIAIENIKKSIEILKNSNIAYEFRTTIIKEHHSIDDIKSILSVIGDSSYYLQNFEDSEYVKDKSLHGFSDLELLEFSRIHDIYSNLFVRGISYTREEKQYV